MGKLWQRRSITLGVRSAVACAIMMGAIQTASANDGLQNFFSSMFGGGQAQPASEPQQSQQPEAAPIERAARGPARPLTVRLRHPKSQFVQAPTRPGKVSIFEDKTLRRGDAVMTARGMRVFAGSRSWPYRDADFVAVTDAVRMDKGIAQTLIALDRLPRQ